MSKGRHGKVLLYRRPDGRVRRLRRHPLWRWSGPLGRAFVVVALPAAAAAWLLGSPRLSLQTVEAKTDGERVSAEWTRQALAPLVGRNLVRLSLPEAERRLAAHPWVKMVRLRKELPDRLSVELTERRPAALWAGAEGLVVVDEAGLPIERLRRLGEPLDLPLLSREGGGPADAPAALELLAEIRAAAPPWEGGVSEIEILGDGDFRVFAESLPFPLLLRAGSVGRKLSYLQELLPALVGRIGPPVAVDLRFERRIVIQPSRRSPQAT